MLFIPDKNVFRNKKCYTVEHKHEEKKMQNQHKIAQKNKIAQNQHKKKMQN